MADVVRYVPGVGMAQGEGNRDTPIFRGNSSTSDFFVDGVRDDVQYFRDLYNVERVEALKGPNAHDLRPRRRGRRDQPRDPPGRLGSDARAQLCSSARGTTAAPPPTSGRRLTSSAGGAGRPAFTRTPDSYRDGVEARALRRQPDRRLALGPATTLRAGYEFFHDDRTADRGIPSFAGRPLDTDPATFFGDPDRSDSDATVHAVSAPARAQLQR